MRVAPLLVVLLASCSAEPDPATRDIVQDNQAAIGFEVVQVNNDAEGQDLIANTDAPAAATPAGASHDR